jgi:hypothetical protein
VLVVPDEWVIDPLVVQRLSRQLCRAPSHVAGVATGSGPLAAGASYRVHAERLMLQPSATITERASGLVRGAVLLRPTARYELVDDGVMVDDGPLLVDHGTHAHDPWQRYQDIATATVLGRPPFPSRPVVLVVVGDPDEGLDDWARRLVNDLVRNDVEARLASPAPTRGLHLTHPVLPDETGFRALRPDVVVTVDDAARTKFASWAGGGRSTLQIDVRSVSGSDPEVVSWRLGADHGPLRARIGRRVDPAALARCVNRLLAGPFPVPPLRPGDVEVDLARHTPDSRPVVRRTRSIGVVTGVVDTAGQRRIEGLVDHLIARSHRAEVIPIEPRPDPIDLDVVVLRGATTHPGALPIAEARASAGRPTLVDIAPSDVMIDGDDVDLTDAARELLAVCGHGLTPSAAVRELARAAGARAMMLPTLVSRPRAGALKQARAGASADRDDPVIGWFVGASGHPESEHTEVVATALRELLGEHDRMSVQLVGDPEKMPGALTTHPRVRTASGPVDGRVTATWVVQVWTPAALSVAVAGDLAPFVDASYVGVPTVMALQNRPAIDGYVHPELVVSAPEEADGWASALRPFVTTDESEWRGEEAIRRIEGLFGGRASAAITERLLGWIFYRGDQR